MPFTPREEIEAYVSTRVNQILTGVNATRRAQVIAFFVDVATQAHNFVVDDVIREIGTGPAEPDAYAYAMAMKTEVETWRWLIP